MPKPIRYGNKPEGGTLDWMTASMNAANELIAASAAARDAGFMRAATASNDAAQFITDNLEAIKDPETELTPATVDKFGDYLEAAEEEIRQEISGPTLMEFQCRQEFEQCIAIAPSRFQKAACCAAFMACLARNLKLITVNVNLG